MNLESENDIITLEDHTESHSSENSTLEVLPILSLRNIILFPGVIIPVSVGREKSLKLIDSVVKSDKLLGVLAQKDASVEDPQAKDLYTIGVVAKIIKQLVMPDGSMTIILQGRRKFETIDFISTDPYFSAHVHYIEEFFPSETLSDQEQDMVKTIRELAMRIMKEAHKIGAETDYALRSLENIQFLVNFLSSSLSCELEEKQKLLELNTFKERGTKLIELMQNELKVLQIKLDIQNKARQDLDKQQREFILHQQIKTIQQELGETQDKEINTLREKAEKLECSKENKEQINKEIERLSHLNPQMSEYSVQLNYCELLVDLPWGKMSKDNYDLKRAEKILNEDHYGLEKIKERILEHLAVLKLKKNMKAPILCFFGPPGVGKTSLGKSISKALSREYGRIALGGMRDEAEIRGHRKTYIGAMPGRIIQTIRKAKTSNPVIVLDEVDKLGRDGQGDPGAALLELLDPEQNNTFVDNFVELEYDLSKVLFIATANNLNTIHPALLDRMEIIEVTGYALEEKIRIAQDHLILQSLTEHGLKKKDFILSDEVLIKVIAEYTRESGVRSLKQKIDKLVRNRARLIANNEKPEPEVKAEELEKILGIPRPQDQFIQNKYAGVVTGLAWTSVGGDILFIESSLTPGKGKLTLTGNLGDVMKESALLAVQYLKANAHLLELDERVFDQYDVHIHFPEGATPKDGPSAGIAILTALSSLFTQRKVKERLAMTGEITLRGKVLPVGGIKEKVLAARRAGITTVILCEDNKKDVLEINPEFIKGVEFFYVKEMEEVLKLALLNEKVDHPIEVKYKEISEKKES